LQTRAHDKAVRLIDAIEQRKRHCQAKGELFLRGKMGTGLFAFNSRGEI